VTRWALASLGALLVLGVATVALSRLFGRSGSRAAILVSVVAHWLGAWVLWSFAGGLALRYGLLGAYPGAFFVLLALGGGIWHYRTAVAGGRERGLVVFVGVQLLWLALVLLQNGAFGDIF
jgi:hypothetical protein